MEDGDLLPHETELMGRWDGAGGIDDVERRIRWLVSSRLESLGSADGGWDWLFRDPRDGRLWELTFPSGSVHGSGPRRLRVTTRAHAEARFGVCEG